jgi:hypothetical protein
MNESMAKSHIYLDLVLGEVLDLATILEILGIAIKDNRHDLVLGSLGKRFDGTVHESGTLTVSTANELGLWAGCSGRVEQFLGLVDASVLSASGQHVCHQTGAIFNTLDGDIRVFHLQR